MVDNVGKSQHSVAFLSSSLGFVKLMAIGIQRSYRFRDKVSWYE